MAFGEQLAGRSVLVTGAYGMLGGWLVEALLDRGARVVVLGRSARPTSRLRLDGLEQRCAVVHGDITDAVAVDRAVAGHEVQAVFHLAAQPIVGTANASPVPTFETNVRGTWILLDACRRARVGQVVVASSDKVYGEPETLPYREDLALNALYPYDVSKAAAELIARSYFHTYGVPVAVTRFGNVYGGGDLNRTRLIPEMVAAILAGKPPEMRSDGTPERDFLHVSDAVDAYLAIADRLVSGEASGETFNGGGGRPVSVRQVVEAAIEVAGADLVPSFRPSAALHGEIDRQWGDSTKLRRMTGWAPQVDLHEGLRRTIEWYRAHPGVLAA